MNRCPCKAIVLTSFLTQYFHKFACLSHIVFDSRAPNSGNEMIYIKHDGSINEGFEIVSHPMTLDYHENHMNWLEVFEKAIEMGYRSHNTSTCGLHIHVSRSAFGRNYADQEVAIARIIYFVEHHWNELLKFSRRTEASMNHWASRYGISENTQDTYKKAKDKHMGRYVAVTDITR